MRTPPRLLIRVEGERPDLVAAMAVQAFRLQNRGHVFAVGRRVLFVFYRLISSSSLLLLRRFLTEEASSSLAWAPGQKLP